ncbi:MAG: hypothetical protein JO015_21610 [Verrucomicrobia bacterium]|nr:hypothetical protein [Verrucomicrobiota bacterium]
MNGYLQRIALSARNPGGSIQPILGSVFSPPGSAGGPETLSINAALPVNVPVPSEDMPRTGPQPPPDGPATRALPAGEPNPHALRKSRATHPGIERARPIGEPYPKAQGSPDPTGTPIPTSNRLPAPLFPGPGEKAETPVAPQFPDTDQGRDQSQPRVLKPPREATGEGTPLKRPVRNQPEAMTPAEASIMVRPVTRQIVDQPAAGPAPGRGVVFASSPGGQAGDSRGGETVPIKAPITTGWSRQQTIEQPATGMPPETRVTGDESRTLTPSAPGPFASGARGHDGEGMDPSRARPAAQPAPDEIRIHIGRIEVIAVPPPPVTPASPKPARRAPSLDEYLRRRDGSAQ